MTKKKRKEVFENGGLKFLRRVDYFYIGIIIAFAVVLYARCLNGELLHDDRLALRLDQDSHASSTGSVWDLFQRNFWGADLSTAMPNNSVCPLTVFTFRFQSWLGGFHRSALALRTVNLTLSALNGAWVYVFAHLLLPSAGSGSAALGPALAMLLFMVHPTHTETVISAVGRADLLSTFFGFSALYCVHRFLVTLAPSAKEGDLTQATHTGLHVRSAKRFRLNVNWRRIVWFICAPLFTALSVLSNENGIAFVGLFLMHALLLLARGWTSRRGAITTGTVSALLVAGYWQFRTRYMDDANLHLHPALRRTESPQFAIEPGIWPWLAMRLLIQVKNVELLFFPTQLCCEYSYNCLPPIESLADARLPVFLTIAATVCTFTVWCAVRLLRHRDAWTLSCTAALMWLVIPYAPVSLLFVQVSVFISERCLYASSIGVVFLIALLFTSPRRWQWRAAASIACAFLLLFWSYITFIRVGDWYNDETLFRSAMRVCPDSGKAHHQLALALAEKESSNRLSPEVLALFHRAYALDSEVKESLYYLAMHEYTTGNAEKALSLLRECTSSPYTVKMCYPLFSRLRSELHPKMKNWQKFEENAAIGYSLEERAAQLRLAGIALAEDEKDFCRSAQYLRRALNLWDESALFWSHARNVKDNVVSFCTTLPYYTEKVCDCLASPDAPRDIEMSVIDTAKFIRHAVMQCEKEPWASVPLARQQEYLHRPAHFDYTMRVLQLTMAQRLLKMTVSDTAARAVRRAIAEAAVRRYCYISTFVQSEVGRQLAAANKEIAAVHSAFFKGRTNLLQTAIEASLGMQSQGESEDFFALLKCAPELKAFLSRNQ